MWATLAAAERCSSDSSDGEAKASPQAARTIVRLKSRCGTVILASPIVPRIARGESNDAPHREDPWIAADRFETIRVNSGEPSLLDGDQSSLQRSQIIQLEHRCSHRRWRPCHVRCVDAGRRADCGQQTASTREVLAATRARQEGIQVTGIEEIAHEELGVLRIVQRYRRWSMSRRPKKLERATAQIDRAIRRPPL